mgnify:CR=1 FL=1
MQIERRYSFVCAAASEVSLTAQPMFARSAVLRLIHRQLCCRCFAVSSLLRTSERHFFYCRLYQTDETIINIKLPNPYAVCVLPLADHDYVDRVADALRSELADVPVLTDDLNKHFCVDLLRIHGREMIFDCPSGLSWGLTGEGDAGV